MEFIGIGGGSGSGKSTVAYELVDSEPQRFEVINLDDYQRPATTAEQRRVLPQVDGMINWDHPDAVRWDDLRNDAQALSQGREVRIDVWAHRSNADFIITRRKIPRVIYPRPILIIEGYLALHSSIIDLYDHTFYIDLDEKTRMERRRQARGGLDNLQGAPDYTDKVLRPMHREFVEPTRDIAQFVIKAANKKVDEIANHVRSNL